MPVLPGIEIGGVSYAADATSGDYYDYLSLPDGSLGIVIADVSGHGIGPALLATETCSYLLALAETCPEQINILSRVNRFLIRHTEDSYFVTMFLARLDPSRRSLLFCTPVIKPTSSTRTAPCRVLESTGLPLGINAEAEFPWAGPVELEPAQIVLFLTNGILEASPRNGMCFGVQRVSEVVSANRHESAHAIAELICHAAREFSHDRPQTDDMTVVVLKVAGDPLLGLSGEHEAAILSTQPSTVEGQREGKAGSL